MTALIIVTYCLAGLVASRWPVGAFVASMTRGRRMDGADISMAAFIGWVSVMFWPGIAVAGAFLGVGRLINRSPIGLWVRWFYTLDRAKRKELLK